MDKNRFIVECSNLGIVVTDEHLSLLNKYYELLVEWNKKINLTSIVLKKDVYLKHFYDSLTLVKVLNFNDVSSLCDVGTGAGFPGIVMKIFFPHLDVTLIDALNKRINFLKEVCKTLNFKNVNFIHGRAEDVAKNFRSCFDVVTARAVASLPILIEYCVPMVRCKKYFIALKGDENLEISQNAIKTLNCTVEKVERFKLPIERSNRTIIKIFKNVENLNYPRKFSEIKRKPL